MKFRHLFYLLASLSMVLSACESDDETSGNNEPPEVVLPSAEFRPNSLTGAYAEDAIFGIRPGKAVGLSLIHI